MNFDQDLKSLIAEIKNLAAEYEEKADKSEEGSVNGGVFYGKKEAFNYCASKIEKLMMWHSKK